MSFRKIVVAVFPGGAGRGSQRRHVCFWHLADIRIRRSRGSSSTQSRHLGGLPKREGKGLQWVCNSPLPNI